MPTTQEKLLDVAESAMRTRGYNAVSFRDLADALGIKSASVHYHFPQKEDLGLALVERYATRFFAALGARSESAATPEQRMDAYCETYRAALTGSKSLCLCGLLGAEINSLPKDLAGAVAAYFQDNIDWVTEALGPDGSKQARHRKAVLAVSSLQGAMMLAISMRDESLFDAAAQQLRASLVT